MIKYVSYRKSRAFSLISYSSRIPHFVLHHYKICQGRQKAAINTTKRAAKKESKRVVMFVGKNLFIN